MLRYFRFISALAFALAIAAWADGTYRRSIESYQIPDVNLIDSSGASTSLRAVLGRSGPVALQFIFTTCPGTCPMLSGAFAATQQQPGLENMRWISISIDPEQDTPPRLEEYARRFHVGRNWLLFTGISDNVITVQKAFEAFAGNKMQHNPLTFLRAKPGASWIRIEGFISASQLAGECRKLVAE